MDLHSVFDPGTPTGIHCLATQLPATGFQHVDVICGDHVHSTNVYVSSVVVTTTYFRRAKSNVPTLTQNNLLEAIWQTI